MQTKINVPIALRNIQRLSSATRSEYWRRTMLKITLGEWFTGNAPTIEERKLALILATTFDQIDALRKGLTKADRRPIL